MNDEEGVQVKDELLLKALGKSYFSSLLSDDGTSCISDQLKVINIYPSFLSTEDASSFLSEVTLEEVEVALKGFKKDKNTVSGSLACRIFSMVFQACGR